MAVQDVRTLIPRVRRALEGPASTGTGPGELTDDQMVTLTADAIADIILYTGGLFGHRLNVTGRDATTNAPEAWEVDPELAPEEETIVATQAALNHFFFVARDLKVQETIRDEGQEWSYGLSATVLRDWIAGLKDARDRALLAVERANPTLVGYVSFLAVRDAATSMAIEPWVDASLAGGQEADPRFG